MYFVFILLGLLALLRGLVSVLDSLRFKHKVDAALRSKPDDYTPKVTLFVPCKQVDQGFRENITSILEQNYRSFRIIFIAESREDPAYVELKQMLSARQNTEGKIILAGSAMHCSQKIHNLLQGLREVEEDTEVLVFADSDIRVPESWLKNLVAPLQNPDNGACTAYRWYLPVPGNFWSAVRSVWNMTSANLLFNENYNFAWGGSTAIRKSTFEELGIAEKWRRALSDDMILTRAVKAAGYRIRFVPQSMVLTLEKTSWTSLIEWTTRQMTIVRVYDPGLWKLAAFPQWIFNMIFILGLILILRGLLFQMAIPIFAWFMVSDLPLGAVINFVRFTSFKKAMPHFRQQMAPFWWVYVGLHLMASFVMSWSLLRSARSTKIIWRGIQYEMRSPYHIVVTNSQTTATP